MPSKQLIQEKKELVLDRIHTYHLKKMAGSKGNIFLISNTYPGVWLEHVYDAVSWVNYDKSDPTISINQIRLFLDRQKPDGQFPCYVIDPDKKTGFKNLVGYSQTQECVSFARLCLETCIQNNDMNLLKECYEKCKKWDSWLTANRMTMKTGLIEMFCGFDTGHDNSGRFKNIKHKGNFSEDAKDYPHDDESLPYITPDMNAVFYGSKTALAVMAGKLNLDEEAHTWKQAAHEVKKKIMEICYDEEDDFFYDIDRNGNKVKCKSISITNLFCESVLDMDTAKEYSINIFDNPQEFKTNYPYPAVSISDPLWQQNLPGNSWGFYSQGLVALRTLRWMDKYGFSEQLEENMKRWISAWCLADKLNFGQELHPITGEPSTCGNWYSSTMLYFIHSLKRLGL
jgi:hypothetical protein